MPHTVEVEIDENGRVHALEPGEKLPTGRALLTFLSAADNEPAQLSERALAEDWLRPEEDAAWAHLQPGR